jgi:hypothetical protein
MTGHRIVADSVESSEKNPNSIPGRDLVERKGLRVA